MRKRVCNYNNDNVYLMGVNEKNKLLWLYPYYVNNEINSLYVVIFTNHTKPRKSKDYVHIDILNFNPNTLIRSPITIPMMDLFISELKCLKSNKRCALESIINIFRPRGYIQQKK